MAAVIEAAKESRPVFPLAAFPLFAENSHQGHQPSSTTFRPGAVLAISNTTTAMPIFSYESAPGFVVVGNNPLSYTDPSGMGPEDPFCVDPVSCGIAVAVDVGLALCDIFCGGGHHTPSLANFPFPNQFPSSSPSGDSSGGYGDGSTDPFVFSFQDATQPQTAGQFIRAYWSTGGFLYNFLTGTGPRIRSYGPNDYRTRDLMSSKGFQVINQQVKQGCQAGKTKGDLNLSTWQGAKDIPYDIFHSPVGGEVGGYNGTWSTSGGTANINIVNYSGAYSFFYHAVNDRTGISGPFRTIKQTFTIKEPSPCGN